MLGKSLRQERFIHYSFKKAVNQFDGSLRSCGICQSIAVQSIYHFAKANLLFKLRFFKGFEAKGSSQ